MHRGFTNEYVERLVQYEREVSSRRGHSVLQERERRRRQAHARAVRLDNRAMAPMSSYHEDSGDSASHEPPATIKGALVKIDPKEVGMLSEYKNLYSGKEDKRGRFQWQNEIPEDVGKPAEDAEAQKYAMLVRHIKVYHDPRRVLSMHSIVVQSPLLKELLAEVLVGYPGVTVGLQRLEFSGRFEPLIHRWSALTAAIADLDEDISEDETVSDATIKRDHAKLLYDLLSEEFKEVIDSSADMTAQ